MTSESEATKAASKAADNLKTKEEAVQALEKQQKDIQQEIEQLHKKLGQ